MLMDQIDDDVLLRDGATPREDRSFAVPLAATAAIAAWAFACVWVVLGPAYWAGSPEALKHLAVCVACMTLAAAYANRVHGSLEAKIGQALTGVFLIFGLYALVLLGARLFFARSMLILSATGATLVALMVVWLRHRLTRERVAIIAPLLGEARVSLPHGRLVRDPATDLRAFDVVLVSLTETVSADWARALSRAMLAGCKVRHVGEYLEELKGAVSVDHFEVEHLPPNGIASYRLVKRLLDIALVVFILPVVVPVFVLAALAVGITMGGPIFFVQERIGLGGEPFRMWKLRTMRPEQPGAAVRAAVHGDRRVTPVGRILRRFRIDELPQLWNVLKGDMSLIGPRPEAAPLHDEYMRQLPKYAYRYLVRPGITGWAQVSAPPSATAEEARQKLTYDLYYVKKLSLGLDLQIVLRTFWTITAGGGVR